MPKKVDNYEEERKLILQKIFTILNINETNNKFLLGKLEKNIEQQNEILQLETQIKKYFICSRWSCFLKPEMKRRYLSMIKYLLKEMGYEVLPVRKRVGDNVRDTEYNVINFNAKMSV
jgi:hypothetical protein